jgi:hypothetical protein
MRGNGRMVRMWIRRSIRYDDYDGEKYIGIECYCFLALLFFVSVDFCFCVVFVMFFVI